MSLEPQAATMFDGRPTADHRPLSQRPHPLVRPAFPLVPLIRNARLEGLSDGVSELVP